MSGTIEHRSISIKHAQIGDLLISDTPSQSLRLPESKLTSASVGHALKIASVSDKEIKTEWKSSGLDGEGAPELAGNLDGKNNQINNVSQLQLSALTSTERDALAPAAGTIIFNSTESSFQGYNGSVWQYLGGFARSIYATSIVKVGASGDFNLTNDTQDIFWSSPTVQGEIFSSSTNGSRFQTTVTGKYRVCANLTLRGTDSNNERYGMLKFGPEGQSESTAGLLVAMQFWMIADSSISSYINLSVDGIVTLQAGVDYVFEAKSENDGTLRVYDWSGSNTFTIEPRF